jgi:uncharacterized membrane protein
MRTTQIADVAPVERTALTVLDSFLAVSAILGGLGLVSGLYAPPAEMLAGSPFATYTVPGLALIALIGGVSLVATVLVARRARAGVAVSVAAASFLLLFEGVELAIIGFTGLLAGCVVLAVLILALAAALWRAERALSGATGAHFATR